MKINYYKVTLLSPSLELEKDSYLDIQKEYNKGTNTTEVLSKCPKKEVATVIVYKALNGKFKEIITKREIPALFRYCYGRYWMTKELPLFFGAAEDKEDCCDFELLDNLVATTKDINEYLQENLTDVSENSNYYRNSKKIFKDKLDSLFENAMDDYLKLIEYLNIHDSSLKKINEKQIKQLKKKYKI